MAMMNKISIVLYFFEVANGTVKQYKAGYTCGD